MDMDLMESFDLLVPREGTNSIKWDNRKKAFGRSGVLPMGVADMDFPAPKPIIDAIKKRADTGLLGYEMEDPASLRAAAGWQKRRNDFDVDVELMRGVPSVMPGVLAALMAFGSPGDSVVIQPPVYPHFYRAVKDAGMKVMENPLLETTDGFVMDYEDLEACFKKGAKILLFCSPHNPTGRVWKREELEKMLKVCEAYDVKIISDEIHSDLIYEGHRHVPLLSLPAAHARALSFHAISKTFNVPSLHQSYVIAKDERMLASFERVQQRLHLYGLSPFGQVAQIAAYEECEPWLDALMAYLTQNRDRAMRFLEGHLPRIKAYTPESTYLLWMDMSKYNKDEKTMVKALVREGNLGIMKGSEFGKEGGFRMNFGCPAFLLNDGLKRLETAMKALRHMD